MGNSIATRILLLFGLIALITFISACEGFRKDCSDLVSDPQSFQLCQAQNGSKEAQYQVGFNAFNSGDAKTAIYWLSKAAQPVSGRKSVYIPPVGNETVGSVVSVNSGPVSSGHNEAQKLLANIYENGLGIDADPKKARKYRRMSNKIYSYTN